MKLNKKDIFEEEIDWSSHVLEFQYTIMYLRDRIKKLNWDRFEKQTPYHLMIKHRLEKIFSVYYKKHKERMGTITII